MNNNQVDEFETLNGQLLAFHLEMNTLVKKSPNDALNKFKLGLVNSVLGKANVFLGDKRLPFPDFRVFDEAAVPSISDVLMILAQYLCAFEKLRTENITMRMGGAWFWRIPGDSEEYRLRTAPPKQLQ